MNAKGLFHVSPAGFVPADRRARDLHGKLALRTDHRPVFMTVRTARNPEFSALAHIVFNKIADGIGQPMEAVKSYLKERTGRYDVVKIGKTVMHIRHSVRFDAMSEEEFRAFWNDCLPIIMEELLGGVKSEERDEILAIIDGKVSWQG